MNNDQLTTLIGIIFWVGWVANLPIDGSANNKRSLPKHPEDTLESINSKDLW